jgi:hypothetical protein
MRNKRSSSLIVLLLAVSGCCSCGSKNNSENHKDDSVVKLPGDGYLVLLEDPSKRSVETSIIVSSEFWQKEIKAHGFNQPLIYDAGSDRGLELVEVVKNRKPALPLLVFLDSQGVVLAASPFPQEINEIKRLLNDGI